MYEQFKTWDRELFVYLNGLGSKGFDLFWIGVTQEEVWIPLYFLFFVLLFFRYKNNRQRAIAIAGFLFSFLAAFGLTRLIKATIQRLRPNNVESLQDVIRVLQEPTHYSFVSGHTSTSMAIATFMVLLLQDRSKWIYLVYIWPALFAYSRIYVGVHYPSDIIAGVILGIACASIGYIITTHYIASKKTNTHSK